MLTWRERTTLLEKQQREGGKPYSIEREREDGPVACNGADKDDGRARLEVGGDLLAQEPGGLD